VMMGSGDAAKGKGGAKNKSSRGGKGSKKK